jgi:hypothetical protein
MNHRNFAESRSMVDKIRERPADDFQRVHIIFLGEFFRSLPDLELQAVFLKS